LLPAQFIANEYTVKWRRHVGAGVAAETVGTDAANELLTNLDHGGCVDDYLQDQVSSPFYASVF